MHNIGPHSLDYFMPEGERLPPSTAYNSPLKRKVITQTALRSVLKCDLGSPKKQKLTDGKSLIKAPSPEENVNYIDQLSSVYRNQVFAIERSLKLSSLSTDQKSMIRDKMIQILKSRLLTEEGKLAELGILYYYLACHKTIPSEQKLSLLNLRLEAIEMEVAELQQIHKRSCKKEFNKLLPSGVTAYLLRTFVRMIFPPDGGFNLGGCHAIKALLNTRLNVLLTEEMRTQILSVLDCLILDSDFLQLFRDPFKVHPQMQQLICLDLKIPLDEEMNFVYVRWSMLTALFSSIGQLQEGNCYAVAPTMNLLSVGKKALVKLMIEILSTGHFSFEGQDIPILPLVETRRRYAGDFAVKMTMQQAHELTPYTVARFALDRPTTPHKEMGNTRKSLGEWIDFEFMDTARTAKELFLSHKLSFLQQALLATLQFATQNALTVTEGYFGWRLKIFKDMIKHIRLSLKTRLEYSSIEKNLDFKNFLEEFLMHLSTNLFLVDYSHSECSVEDGKRVVFDFHSQGFKFNGNLKDYVPFQSLRRLLHLSEGVFKPVDKLSDFIDYCIKSLDALTPSEMKPSVKIGQRLLKQHLTHPLFRENMAKQIARSNKRRSNLDWQHYDESDSFFLIQGGGRGWFFDDLQALEGKFSSYETLSSKSLDDFFVNLCAWSSANFEEAQSGDYNSDPLVLTIYKGHVLNMTPFRFSSYWKSLDPAAELRTRVIEPGINLKQRVLSREEMVRALMYVDGLSIDEEFVDECIEKNQMTVEAFHAQVMEVLQKDDHIEFNEALIDVIGEFTFESLEENFSLLLFSLGVELNYEEYKEVIDTIGRTKKSKFLLNSFIAGALIQKALISCSKSIFIPLRTIEAALCRCYNLPEFVELANLNWVQELSEQLGYKYMGITFDIFKGELVLCKRRGEFISIFDSKKTQSIYKEITIFSHESLV